MILSAGEIQVQSDVGEARYDYQYPNGLNLRPGADDHQKLLDRLRRLALDGNNAISKRIDRFQQTDKVLTAYMPLDDEETAIKQADERKPVSIVYPYSLAILETMIAYIYSALLNGTVFRYRGVGPEDTLGALLLEKVIDYQVYRSRIKLNLLTMIRDSLAYGFGAAVPGWVVKEGEIFSQGYGVPQAQWGITYEGNSLLNIDPYLVLPDPQVPIHEVQRAEFLGWGTRTNYQGKLRDELYGSGSVFNVKYLKHIRYSASVFANRDGDVRDWSKGGTFRELEEFQATRDRRDVFDVDLYVDVIPQEWGIGPGEYPEKWWFTFSNDQIITRMERLSLPHGEMPVVVTAPNTDGYASTPLSHIETLSGLQGLLDFLMNAHVKSMRKNINNTYIVDQQMINMKDMKTVSEQGGGYVRLRRPAMGKGVKDYVEQLPVVDVTRQNLGDAQLIIDTMHRVSGADEWAMGAQRRGGPERLTGGEHQATRQGLFTRLERISAMIGLQGLQPLGEMFASHAQKFMSQETWVEVQGEWKEVLSSLYGVPEGGRIRVGPEEIRVNNNVRVSDGSVPDVSTASFWFNTFDLLSQHPELQQRFDITKVFRSLAVRAGEKNVDDFIRTQPPPQAQVQPNEQVMEQAQAGTLQPIGGMM